MLPYLCFLPKLTKYFSLFQKHLFLWRFQAELAALYVSRIFQNDSWKLIFHPWLQSRVQLRTYGVDRGRIRSFMKNWIRRLDDIAESWMRQMIEECMDQEVAKNFPQQSKTMKIDCQWARYPSEASEVYLLCSFHPYRTSKVFREFLACRLRTGFLITAHNICFSSHPWLVEASPLFEWFVACFEFAFGMKLVLPLLTNYRKLSSQLCYQTPVLLGRKADL